MGPYPRLESYFLSGGLLVWSDGCALSIGFWVSIGFCVSVGWPLTSPGLEAAPVELPTSGVVADGAAGRWTLPLEVSLPVVAVDELVSVPVLAGALVSVPVVALLDDEVDGAVTLPLFEVEVLTSPLDDGCVASLRSVESLELPERCMLLVSLDSVRPCALVDFLCFLCFAPVAVVSAMPLIELLELSLVEAVESPGPPVVEVPVAELSAGAFTALEFVEVLGSALVLPVCEFWMPAVPLSSPDAFGVLDGVFALLSVDVVWARAPNAERARASAAVRMIFTWSPPWVGEETVATQRRFSNDRAKALTPRRRTRNRTYAWRWGS